MHESWRTIFYQRRKEQLNFNKWMSERTMTTFVAQKTARHVTWYCYWKYQNQIQMVWMGIFWWVVWRRCFISWLVKSNVIVMECYFLNLTQKTSKKRWNMMKQCLILCLLVSQSHVMTALRPLQLAQRRSSHLFVVSSHCWGLNYLRYYE